MNTNNEPLSNREPMVAKGKQWDVDSMKLAEIFEHIAKGDFTRRDVERYYNNEWFDDNN